MTNFQVKDPAQYIRALQRQGERARNRRERARKRRDWVERAIPGRNVVP